MGTPYDDLICYNDLHNDITTYSYRFEPDVKLNTYVNIPRNILYLREQQLNDKHNLSFSDDWTYYYYSNHQQYDFVAQYFPNMLNLFDLHGEIAFIYLWLYLNGGIYISSEYEIEKSLGEIVDNLPYADIYIMKDNNGNFTNKIYASHPQCGFWLDNIGKEITTDSLKDYLYQVLPKSILEPYSPYNITTKNNSTNQYIKHVNIGNTLMGYVQSKTSTNNTEIYMVAIIIVLIIIMGIIAF